MGRKGNFPLQELPLHILELPSRAEIEVRISVCNFPSSTPLPVSQAPPQHLLGFPRQGEARVNLSSQTFASVKVGGGLGAMPSRAECEQSSRNSLSSHPALTWCAVACTAASTLGSMVGHRVSTMELTAEGTPKSVQLFQNKRPTWPLMQGSES